MITKQLLKKEDKKLIERIQSRIRWDIRVSNSDVSVHVRNGCVTLLGYFDKPYRHAAAVEVITTTEGVEDFRDKSKVTYDYFRADKELETLISKQILALPFMPGEWINIQVCKGVARLEGHVFRPRLKAFAARAAWELSGIEDCINLIDLKENPQMEKKARPIFKFTKLLRSQSMERNLARGA